MLFKPYKLKELSLRNRIVMAPMTRSQSPGGIPTEKVASYYERRAKGQVGLIITEGIEVSHIASSGYPDVPRLDSEDARDGWKEVIRRIKESGGSVIAQLWHCGAMRKLGMDPDPAVPGYTPSGLTSKDKKRAYTVNKDEIKILVKAYGQDAKWCEEVGFDGVEIHGAHGYLVDNFFWEITNERSDNYGGSIENRSQFAKEITQCIRSKVSNKFIVGMRFSQWKQQDYTAKLANNPQELEEMLMPIVNAGLDYLHSSNRKFWEKEFDGSEENLAYWTQKISGLPTITVGSVGLESKGDGFINMTSFANPVDIGQAIKDVNEEKYDLVAVGRALLADPEWVIKMKENRMNDVIPYTEKAIQELR